MGGASLAEVRPYPKDSEFVLDWRFFPKMASKYTCLGTMELVVFLVCSLFSASLVEGGGNILVLVDNINIQDTHSIFFSLLKGNVTCFFVAGLSTFIIVLSGRRTIC